MARTACLVFASLVLIMAAATKKKRKEEETYLWKAGTSSGHIANLKQSILETFDIYGKNTLKRKHQQREQNKASRPRGQSGLLNVCFCFRLRGQSGLPMFVFVLCPLPINALVDVSQTNILSNLLFLDIYGCSQQNVEVCQI
jgi:hypothetical protein